jgi:glycine oxidase
MAAATAQPSPDLAVVGAGTIGLAAAWRAAQRGLRVVVLERDTPGAGASRIAAGMLAPVAEASYGEEALLELGLASAAAWPGFAAEVEAAAGRPAGYVECGTMIVAADADQAAALERELAFRQRLGLPAERLLPSAARGREPALHPGLRAAVEVAGDHAVDPRALVPALAAAAAAAGAQVRPGAQVAEVLVAGGCVGGVRLAGGEEIRAGAVLAAAGCWSGGLPGLPDEARIPVRPVKGQILRLRDPAGPGLLGRIVRSEECYLVPYGDGRFALGGTVEERGFDTAVTAGAVFELLRAASELVPGVWELELDEAAAGLRPGTPDNAPVIGPGALPGLLWATGHFRNGILLTPVTAELAAAAAAGEPPDARAAGFLAERFGAGVAA